MEKYKIEEASGRNYEEFAGKMSVRKYNNDEDDNNGDDTIKINIKDSKDQKYPIHINVNSTVSEIRHSIGSRYGTVSANTQFLYGGQMMENDKTLQQYNVQQDHVISMWGEYKENNHHPNSVDPQREKQRKEAAKSKKDNSIYPPLPTSEALPCDDKNHKDVHENEYCSENHTTADKIQSQKRQLKPREENKPDITVEDLVSTLANSLNFSMSILELVEDFDAKPSLIKNIIHGKADTFTFEDDIVTLKPTNPLCTDYINKCCISKKDCKSLHICGEFLAETCNSKLCMFGHNWFTDHNTSVLKKFNVHHLSEDLIFKLIKQSNSTKKQRKSDIEICIAYNNGSCTQINCYLLHICFNLVYNKRECKLPICKLNHNIMDDSCLAILQEAGISTNETPVDILDTLSEVLKLAEDHTMGESSPMEVDNPSQHTGTDHNGIKSVPSKTYNNHSYNSDVSSKSLNSMGYPASSSSSTQSLSSNSTLGINSSASSRSTNSSGNSRYSKTSSHSIHEASLSSSKSNIYSNTQVNSFNNPKFSPHNVENQPSSMYPSLKVGSTLGSNSSYNTVYSSNSSSANSSSYSKTSSSNPSSKKDPWSVGLNSQYGYNNQPTKAPQSNIAFVSPGCRPLVTTISEIGNTEIPEICYYSVFGKCKSETVGCRRLHSKNHYHWQVEKISGTWLNLQSHQVECLEKYYCNPACDTIVLPFLKQNYTGVPSAQLLALLGMINWNVDFQKRNISGMHISKPNLRRLTSEKIASQPVCSNTYIWYFKDERGRWIEYGKVDSLGRQQLKSAIGSQDIEREFVKYLMNRNKNVMMFNNAMFNYIIDFDAMTQTNTKTNVKRAIKRRPEFRQLSTAS